MKSALRAMILFALAATVFAAADVSLSRSPAQAVDKVKLSDLDFIAGRWQGELGGGITEEHWSTASGNSMMGMFRYVKDGKAVFYELMLIEHTTGVPALKLKHFNPGLIGWEEKAQAWTYPLVEFQKNRAVFERSDKESALIFDRTSADSMSVTLERVKDGKKSSEEFKYRLMP
ncbi:MAG TPA: DUF6265 family protein [Blastocatellia bacterium]|jgi:hypothetical protein|nr:DUF6265 family protein [Blastocatellia bacterium]